MERTFPDKIKDMLFVWSEYNMLAAKYGAINLAHGTPTVPTPKFAVDNLIKATTEGHNQYTAVLGAPILREAIGKEYQSRFNRELDINTEIVITCGASAALQATIQSLCGEGDELLTFTPFYPNYGSITHLGGAIMKTLPLETRKSGDLLEYYYDWEKFEEALNPKTKVVLLTNPHNPTGKCLSEDDIKTISEILDRKAPQAWVISDDVYDFLTFDDRKCTTFAAYENNWERTVTLFSAGKLMNATGWKIGWLIGPANMAK